MKPYYYLEDTYYYANPETNDVAVCSAPSLDEAVDKFKKLYRLASRETVHKCTENGFGVCVLTAY